MAVVELKKNITVEDVFDAIVDKAGSLDTSKHPDAFEALMAVAHAIMADGKSPAWFGELGMKIKHRTH